MPLVVAACLLTAACGSGGTSPAPIPTSVPAAAAEQLLVPNDQVLDGRPAGDYRFDRAAGSATDSSATVTPQECATIRTAYELPRDTDWVTLNRRPVQQDSSLRLTVVVMKTEVATYAGGFDAELSACARYRVHDPATDTYSDWTRTKADPAGVIGQHHAFVSTVDSARLKQRTYGIRAVVRGVSVGVSATVSLDKTDLDWAPVVALFNVQSDRVVKAA